MNWPKVIAYIISAWVSVGGTAFLATAAEHSSYKIATINGLVTGAVAAASTLKGLFDNPQQSDKSV